VGKDLTKLVIRVGILYLNGLDSGMVDSQLKAKGSGPVSYCVENVLKFWQVSGS